MTLRRPIGRPLIVLAALSMAAGALALSGGPASADVTCPTVTGGNIGTVSPAPTPGVDWQGCNLSEADLGGADLAGANLSHANLQAAQLTNANLTGADLTSASVFSSIIANADLTDADLAHANLDSAILGEANLTDADAAGASLGDADVSSATVTGVDLTGANLDGVVALDLIGTPSSLPAHWSFRYHDLMGPGVFLSDVSLNGDDLAGLDLAGADLMQAKLADANLTGTNLGQADLTYSDLDGANLTHADLPGATEQWADLTDARFVDANLTDDTLTAATVTKTDLAGANLTGVAGCTAGGTPSSLPAHWLYVNYCLLGPGADLTAVVLDGAFNLTGADLAGANLSQANLAGANLTGANLSKANLIDAFLNGVNLTRATIDGADLAGTSTLGVIWSDTICANGLNSNLYADGCNTGRLYGFHGFLSPARRSTLPVSSPEVTVTFRLTFINGDLIDSAAARELVARRWVRATIAAKNFKAVTASCVWRTAAKDFGCALKLPTGIKAGKAHPYWITVAENGGHGFKTAPPDRGALNPEYVYFK